MKRRRELTRVQVFRLSAAEHKELLWLAKRRKMSVSEMVRACVQSHLGGLSRLEYGKRFSVVGSGDSWFVVNHEDQCLSGSEGLDLAGAIEFAQRAAERTLTETALEMKSDHALGGKP